MAMAMAIITLDPSVDNTEEPNGVNPHSRASTAPRTHAEGQARTSHPLRETSRASEIPLPVPFAKVFVCGSQSKPVS